MTFIIGNSWIDGQIFKRKSEFEILHLTVENYIITQPHVILRDISNEAESFSERRSNSYWWALSSSAPKFNERERKLALNFAHIY